MKNNASLSSSSALVRLALPLALGALVPLHGAPIESNSAFAVRSATNDLQLVVSAPASLNLAPADNVSGTLTTLVGRVFQQSGFRGQLLVVPSREPLEENIPSLQVYILDWRITGKGSVECSFTATLTTPGRIDDLGVISGTSLPMLGLHNQFNRAEAFDQAATDAAGNLYGELREKNLLPASIL